ncbi:MAG: flagella basal body P-ring formation protein FlgA [Alphaproteobacteria bacterium 64-11]|nr:flagellar basal body P-ring formation protein FlgA [Alphaproteobacteria bacterium]OJU10686.1 MAG: flagella basal body P-ring formation protein FlgA [Alphaproteobacteria bacterium 64-11]
MMRKLILTLTLCFALPTALLAATSAFAATVRIVVPARDIARGDVIGESDLTYVTVDGNALMSGVATSMDEIKGMQARRVLGAGQPLRGTDVRRPIVVSKGQVVTMVFSAPGVEVTATGRAMTEGGVGDTVTVQNPASYRMISATVTAPGTVRADGGVISSPTRTASR